MKVNGWINLSHILHFQGLNLDFNLSGTNLSANYTFKEKMTIYPFYYYAFE